MEMNSFGSAEKQDILPFLLCERQSEHHRRPDLRTKMRTKREGEEGRWGVRFPSKGINRQCELERAREIYVREACIRERLYY